MGPVERVNHNRDITLAQRLVLAAHVLVVVSDGDCDVVIMQIIIITWSDAETSGDYSQVGTTCCTLGT